MKVSVFDHSITNGLKNVGSVQFIGTPKEIKKVADFLYRSAEEMEQYGTYFQKTFMYNDVKKKKKQPNILVEKSRR